MGERERDQGHADKVGSALMAEDALAKIAKADQMIYDLCQGKKRWTMSVPAQPDSDPDLVIHDALAVARLAINTLVREGCARSAGTRTEADEITEKWRTGLIYRLRMLAKATPYMTAPSLIDEAIEAANYLEEAGPVTRSASEACIERCEKYLHGEAIGSICGLRKLERENATKSVPDSRADRG